MRDRLSDHRIQVDLSVDPRAVDARPDVDAPFCIALFGDFSARAHRGSIDAGGTIATRESLLVDRDNLDDVLAGLRPELRVPVGDERDFAVRIEFQTLDDFHPDRLYERLPVFEGVRELRRRLAAPATREQPPRESSTAEQPPAAVGGNLLDQIVQQSPSPYAGAAEERSPLEGGDLQTYLNRIVSAHLVPDADPRRQTLLAELDAACAAGLRALLHHPDFQALEALWRGVQLITRAVESDADVRLHLFDVTKSELAADQRESADAANSRLCRLLAAGAPQSGWGVLCGLYSFGPLAFDRDLVRHLGSVARVVKAPWISAGDPLLVGCTAIDSSPDPADWVAEPPPEWHEVRRSPDARWIGLAMPGFLLRSPYGQRYNASDALPFEELSEAPTHAEYLWGNPALACLLLLVQGVAESGRPIYPGMNLELGGLPLLSSQPCTEALLGERAAERILDGGLMPLVSIRDTDRVRLRRFQSVADPLAALGGGAAGSPEQ